MTNESQMTNSQEESTAALFGARLRSARQKQGLELKDVSAQLRLNEKLITTFEEGVYPDNIPMTFLRGYLRAYGKLLLIPADEVKAALLPIKETPLPLALPQTEASNAFTSENYYMRFFTYLIVFTMLGLVGIWWHNHTSATETTLLLSAQNENGIPLTQSSASTLGVNQLSVEKAPSQIASSNGGAPTLPSQGSISSANSSAAASQPTIALANPKHAKPAEDALYGEDADADETNN